MTVLERWLAALLEEVSKLRADYERIPARATSSGCEELIRASIEDLRHVERAVSPSPSAAAC
jgi:hypothetical protein